MTDALLEIENLQTHFHVPQGVIRAVDGVSLSVRKAESVGIVGESGCGKSVLIRSILRLIPQPPAKIIGGSIRFACQDLVKLSECQMQRIRGNEISMIFQEPMTSLNPVYTIGFQMMEVFRKHRRMTKAGAEEAAVEMLRTVGIPSPEKRFRDYPFQMSGGMLQRVIIAMALACEPQLILADEPTTAVDVTIQAQILNLMSSLERKLQTSMILITHDLGVIAETVHRVFVMYAGQIVEQASVCSLFDNPLHPYTEGLMLSIPAFSKHQNKDSGPLKEIPGLVPDLGRLPEGCYFSPRCHRRHEFCAEAQPSLREVQPGHWVRCLLHE